MRRSSRAEAPGEKCPPRAGRKIRDRADAREAASLVEIRDVGVERAEGLDEPARGGEAPALDVRVPHLDDAPACLLREELLQEPRVNLRLVDAKAAVEGLYTQVTALATANADVLREKREEQAARQRRERIDFISDRF